VIVRAPSDIEQDVLSQLQLLLGTATDKPGIDKIKEAINHLIKSLGAKDGEKVFNEEKDAVAKLMELIKKYPTLTSDLRSLIDRLIGASYVLASIAIQDATNTGGDSKEIDKANDEMLKTQGEIAKGYYDNAIEHYRNAWEHAQHAMK